MRDDYHWASQLPHELLTASTPAGQVVTSAAEMETGLSRSSIQQALIQYDIKLNIPFTNESKMVTIKHFKINEIVHVYKNKVYKNKA